MGNSCLFMTGLLGNSLLFAKRLGVSLLFSVRRQNMCLIGTLTIRGPSFFTCFFQCVTSPLDSVRDIGP